MEPEGGTQESITLSEGGTQGNVTLQLQCSTSSSAEDVRKLLEEKLDRHLDGYTVVFNNSEV